MTLPLILLLIDDNITLITSGICKKIPAGVVVISGTRFLAIGVSELQHATSESLEIFNGQIDSFLAWADDASTQLQADLATLGGQMLLCGILLVITVLVHSAGIFAQKRLLQNNSSQNDVRNHD